MKYFQKGISDLIYGLTVELIRREALPENQWHDVAIRATELVLGCAARKELSLTAGDVFWTAVSNCQVGREEVAMLMNPSREQMGKKKLKATNVRDLMHDARIQIKKCVEKQTGIKL